MEALLVEAGPWGSCVSRALEGGFELRLCRTIVEQ